MTEPDLESTGARAPMSPTRPMYWSLRRELWENRSLYLAPLVVAAVVLFATALSLIGLPKRIRAAGVLGPAMRHTTMVRPFELAPVPIMLACFIVGVFYALDALYGERRDRSILFWKSMPVSDRTTVLAKAAIPILVLPVIAYVLSVITQLTLMMLGTMILSANGMNPAALWGEVRFFSGLVLMLYGLSVHALWFAPIYGWLLLVSAWARRTPVLWAVFPPLAVAAVEHILFSTSSFLHLLQYRVIGAMKEAFASSVKTGGAIDHFSQLDPLKFMSAPGLWIGLLFAAAFLALALRQRRNREPI